MFNGPYGTSWKAKGLVRHTLHSGHPLHPDDYSSHLDHILPQANMKSGWERGWCWTTFPHFKQIHTQVMSSPYSPNQFPCPQCNWQFHARIRLINHLQELTDDLVFFRNRQTNKLSYKSYIRYVAVSQPKGSLNKKALVWMKQPGFYVAVILNSSLTQHRQWQWDVHRQWQWDVHTA